jgi:AcrR family transcriptional regulator
MSNVNTARQSDVTRRRILDAAFAEFFRNGFQGGSLNHVVEAAGVTKGALFHHFAGKQELGYAVVDEVIEPLLMQRWLGGLEGAADPIAVMQDCFRRWSRDDIESGGWMNGCPLNNVAQEMSPLDEGFRGRVDALYDRWRGAFAAALARGTEAGTVRAGVSPESAAALLVASQMGIWGTGKTSRDAALMLAACEAVCDYLDGLRPSRPPTQEGP